MTAYYNEIDLYAAQWLRNLIAAGHIAPGDVDERSIEDVCSTDLVGYTQCHFFAGIGVWSYALRSAGWSDDRQVWTGSCPCQPFSAAGKGKGFADERHLWPAFFHLIEQCRPSIVLGEQVASKDAEPWLDTLQDDLEALGYAVGAIPFPSASVGAPHIRDRLYWVADASGDGCERRRAGQTGNGRNKARVEPERFCDVGGMDHADHAGLEGLGRGHQAAGRYRQGTVRPVAEAGEFSGLADAFMQQRQNGESGIRTEHTPAGRYESAAEAAGLRGDLRPGPVNGYWSDADWLFCRDGITENRFIGGMADANGRNSGSEREQCCGQQRQQPQDGGRVQDGSAGPVNGFWRDADWLFCRDGKWRPVEPGAQPLVASASGSVGRVRADWHAPAGKEGFGHRAGRLRAYGNAINAEAARVFIAAVMECRP